MLTLPENEHSKQPPATAWQVPETRPRERQTRPDSREPCGHGQASRRPQQVAEGSQGRSRGQSSGSFRVHSSGRSQAAAQQCPQAVTLPSPKAPSKGTRDSSSCSADSESRRVSRGPCEHWSDPRPAGPLPPEGQRPCKAQPVALFAQIASSSPLAPGTSVSFRPAARSACPPARLEAAQSPPISARKRA